MSDRVYPLAAVTYKISSGFGPRWGSQHNGLDFAAPLGTPIYAVADGVVVEGSDRRANTVDGFGNWVWIDHQKTHGVDTIYGHMRHADIKVRAGDRVKAGQLIALVGNEGQSTGAHLHFEVWTPPGRIGGRAQDPAAWLAGAGNPVAAATPTPAAPKPAPTPTPASGGTSLKPAYREIIRFGPSSSSRNGARVSNFLLHTEEGNASAEGLAAFCNNPGNGASYHYVVRDGIVVCINDTDRASWSVLNANPYTINLVFAGSRAAWSREDWLRREGDIRIAAWLAVQDARKYGFSIEVNPRPYPLGRRDGFSDHGYVTRVLRIGNHTDTGDRFPWDRFAVFVDEFVRGVTAPHVVVVNKIDEMAAAASWLGKRLTGEESCPDGVGKFAHFENGSIYWTPTTDARPIPKYLLESYATYKWETGPLGYPIAYHTSLFDKDGKWEADVQAFEKGVLYRRVGSPLGFYVTGRIGARWAREGYEKSAYGYPTSNEIHLGDGTVIQNFEHGRIAWNPDGTLGLKLDVGVEQIVQQVH
ncbi:peptidoglycan DD-metalloendopeptidase family protein [Rhodococcoides fascians]|uniref:peptidoglycan DD-metalloendopeptidase family protein n=1 Tax=Rhodococcoides fascians TaxID=1828 RepID=UPI001E31554A|nr:peptidoglycan DD-metalloendopeptidase family protein [Rhodococcus fascians]